MSPTNSEIAALDGEGRIPAYVARPDADTTRAIIVIPEIFGVNEGIRKKADDWAALGYLAIAPDIFWRFAPGVELSPDVESEFQEALGYFGQYDADLGVKDIEAAIRWLRSQGATKVGCVGFCLGGRLAYMAATRTDIDASVLHDYAGLDHGFAATMGNRRNDDGAQLADSRTRDFFAEALA